MMKKFFNIPNVYIILWMLYNTQGLFFSQGGIIGRIVLLMFLGISLVCWATVIHWYLKGPYLKALTFFLILLSIYGSLYLFSTDQNSFDYLKLILLSLLPPFSIYLFTVKGQISQAWLRTMSILLLLVALYKYYDFWNKALELSASDEMGTINVAYDLLALLPLAYFWKKKPIIEYVYFGFVAILVFATVKRGAIVISGLCLVLFFVSNQKYERNDKRAYIWVLSLLFIFLGARFVSQYFAQNDYLQLQYERVLEGDSSGRDVIYSRALDVFNSYNPIRMLVGHGANGTLHELGIYAHNDWLELLVNQGILGVVVYLIYWFAFVKEYRKRVLPHFKPTVLMVMTICFSASLFSMSYNAMHLPLGLALGYSLASSEWDCSTLS